MDGDLAIIRPGRRVENGEIATVIVQDVLPEATLKIVRWTRSALTLHRPTRPTTPWFFKAPRRKRVSILGKFAGIVRRA